MFDAWVVGLFFWNMRCVCLRLSVYHPHRPLLSDGLCGLLLSLSSVLKCESLHVFISSSPPRLLSPAARAVSRPCTSQLTMATSTWPRCCSTEGLPSTSWLGWVYSALCCPGVVLPALKVNMHRLRRRSCSFLKMQFGSSFLFIEQGFFYSHNGNNSVSWKCQRAKTNLHWAVGTMECWVEELFWAMLKPEKKKLFLFCREHKIRRSVFILRCLETPSLRLFKNRSINYRDKFFKRL